MADSSQCARPVFDPVDTSFDPSAHVTRDDVESPSLTSGNALARFEFEPGRSKDGTKVLMVEWEEDYSTKNVAGDWEISWEGKRTVLPARDQNPGEETPTNRLYFLLGPGVNIPTAVRLQKGSIVWRTNPLPAIFSPELGATARQAGKKGVLHTIWAKKRLQVLTMEIEQESKENAEGIGLEMAAAEKEWIEQNFGVETKPGNISIDTRPAMASITGQGSLHSPTSPRSPGGGRLMDKLKGLKLGTTASDLSRKDSSAETGHLPEYQNPLSPEQSDVAVGSFGSFAALKGALSPATMAAKPPQPPTQQSRKFTAQRPPEAFAAQQRQHASMGSLNAFASGDVPPVPNDKHDDDDDLFALPMSPRSPDMSKSPFSFAAQDTVRYLKGGRA
ncbi:hypothetical protein DOTSEDRAFT_75172 [Dothistroma septosporum NZE10]|uniref:Uncharacterized protein n=1 Tax=Dothistroma septosporum (strain NZE10 / CBS 128990) TaxID=675120 RepID=M2YK88_DOTSN|nr:hypothetical protein DOTSEDRAFT_75172 [Dothistroma septosporum NZE10]